MTDLLTLDEEMDELEDLSEFSISPFDPKPSILVHEKPSDLTKQGTFSIFKNLQKPNLPLLKLSN